jgi:hypothetical protein
MFLDLSKAFDSLNHGILFDKLYIAGVRGVALDLLRSYLCNRRQYVCISGSNSKLTNLIAGVPQGSVLGPLLYLVYINDIGRLPLNGKLNLWADDTAYFISIPDRNMMDRRILEDLGLLIDFFKVNKLSVNVSKSNIMIFDPRRGEVVRGKSYVIHGESLCVVNEYRYLGVLFESKLNWGPHVSSVCSRVSRIIGIIRKLSYTLPTYILKILYFSLIHCHLSYCIETWGLANKSVLQQLQILQNRAIKIIYKLPILTSTLQLYKMSGTLCIRATYYLQLGLLVKKILSGQFQTNFEFRYNQSSHNTRNADHLFVVKANNTYGSNNFLNCGPRFFNLLPLELRESSTSLINFKKRLKHWLLEDHIIERILTSGSPF